MSSPLLQFRGPCPKWPGGLWFDHEHIITADQAQRLAVFLLVYASHAPSDENVKRYNLAVDAQNRDAEIPRPATRPRPCFIYVMHDPHTALFKIGRSYDPKVRESTLQGEKPSIELLFAAPAGRNVEAELHARFAAKRVRGEWFQLDAADVAA